jgi:hypothetical protein
MLILELFRFLDRQISSFLGLIWLLLFLIGLPVLSFFYIVSTTTSYTYVVWIWSCTNICWPYFALCLLKHVLAILKVPPASRPKINEAKVAFWVAHCGASEALMWRLRRSSGAVWRPVAQNKYNFYWESRTDFFTVRPPNWPQRCGCPG